MGYFISRNEFRSAADLDGKAAADYLKAQGAGNVHHKDLGRNGLAVGNLDGGFVALSTNGFYSFYETESAFHEENPSWLHNAN